MVGPALVVFVAFVIFPVILAAYYGFFSWNGYGPAVDFVGLRNYFVILTDPAFHEALGHNVFIAVMSLVLQGPIALGLALLLNRQMRYQSVIRVLIFVPYVISEVVVGIGWSLMLQSNGALNGLLEKIGLGALAADWLSDPSIAIWTLMVIITWKYIGFAVILFLAGLQGIPDELSRGRRDRRRVLLADPAPHRAAAARTDDPHLGVPLDHRLAAAVRPRLDHLGPVRRLHRRHVHNGDLHGRQRPQRRQLRLRQRRRRRDVPHLTRRRAALPALPAPPRHGRAPSQEGRSDGRAYLEAPPARDAPRTPGSCRSGGCSIYFVALVLIGLMLAPVAYIILGGFRSNSEITVDPSGLADRVELAELLPKCS